MLSGNNAVGEVEVKLAIQLDETKIPDEELQEKQCTETEQV